MAQLRQDYQKFVDLGAEIITLGPDGPRAFKKYWEEHDMPYIGCADIRSKISDLFYQEVNLFKLGRMPAVFIVDLEGKIRYVHYGSSMSDIPENDLVLAEIEKIR